MDPTVPQQELAASSPLTSAELSLIPYIWGINDRPRQTALDVEVAAIRRQQDSSPDTTQRSEGLQNMTVYSGHHSMRACSSEP
jgi:hypothetical protein